MRFFYLSIFLLILQSACAQSSLQGGLASSFVATNNMLTSSIGELAPQSLTDADGNTINSTVLLTSFAGPLEIPLLQNENAWLRIYPNPASETLNIRIPNAIKAPVDVAIYDCTGSCIYYTICNLTSPILQIYTAPFSQGLYLLQVKSGVECYNEKIQIIH